MRCICPPDYGIVVMWSCLAGIVGIIAGIYLKRSPPYEDDPPNPNG